MSMLKYAYNLGFQEAIKQAALTPEQMQAAQIASGVGGGLAGAAGGGLLGKYLGGRVGETLDDSFLGLGSRASKERGQLVGAGLGALLGGGAGGLAGSQLPRALARTTDESEEQEAAGPAGTESALGALPIAYSGYDDPYADYGYYY